MFLKKLNPFLLMFGLFAVGIFAIFFCLLFILNRTQQSTLQPRNMNQQNGSDELLKPPVSPTDNIKKETGPTSPNKDNTLTNIHIADQFGEVVLSIFPIPGVPSSTSQFININDGLFEEYYSPVPWLTKTTDQPPGLKEYIDNTLNIKFLYPTNRGKLEWDPKNKEFFIKGNYQIEGWNPPSFRISFSKNIAIPRVDIGYASPSHFCAKRLATHIPEGGILGCFGGTDPSLVYKAIVQGWDNDAGYMVVEADAELTNHPNFQSVNIKLQYSNLDTEIDIQTLLYILDSIRTAR